MGFLDILRSGNPTVDIFIDVLAVFGAIWVFRNSVLFLLLCLQGFRNFLFARWVPRNLKRRYGDWVVITGATDGVGLQYAREFACRKHPLILLGRNPEKLQRVKAELEAAIDPPKIETHVVDFNDAQPLEFHELAKAIRVDDRDIGLLINMAGVMYDSPNKFLDQPEEKILQQIRVNITSLLLMTRIVMPGMLRRKRGLVVNMSSIAGYEPLPLMGVYSSSKKFVEWFSRTLEYEYRGSGVEVQTLVPSYINTKMTKFSDFLQRPSVAVPDVESFVRSSFATMGYAKHTTGFWSHGVQYFLYEWTLPSWLYMASSWLVLTSIDSTTKRR